MFKKSYFILTSLVCIIFLYGCSEEKKQDYFNGIVLEIHDTYLLVQPNEDESIYNSHKEIFVTKDIVSTNGLPDLEIGEEIRIVYNGINEDKESPGLKTVFAIYKASDQKKE